MSGGPGSVLPVSSLEKEIWTTLIRGDLDEDDNVFNSIVKAFKENFDDINAGYRHYNKKNLDFGTHARVLLVAAMMTHGTYLSLGLVTTALNYFMTYLKMITRKKRGY